MKNIILSFCLAATSFVAFAATDVDRKLLGPNVHVFAPSDSPDRIREIVESVFKKQRHRQFGPERYAFLFLPGDYTEVCTVNVGYYTQLLGLGETPCDVKLFNVKTPAALPNNNATCNFWVGIENLSIVDNDDNQDPYFGFQWAVSQAAPARRLYVERKTFFDWYYGWASGGYVADTVFKKAAGSYSQQQYYYRNDEFDGGVFGINWNQVIQGCEGSFAAKSKDGGGKELAIASRIGGDGVASNWKAGGCTTIIGNTDVIREKPFLFVRDGSYKVFVPTLRHKAKGVSWSKGKIGEGKVLDLVKDFHVAYEGKDDADSLNGALSAGKNILLTPGVYHLKAPLKVTKAGTVILGIGEATMVPDNDDAALKCADVDGITIAGVIFDAERASRRFVALGERKTGVSHAADPTVLHDVIYRVGGTGKPGKTEVCLEINSNDVIIDHTWVWRADHGDYTGWNANCARNGIVVNGDNVIGYGLFVEHFQEYDVLWKGENGRTYFLQNEKCYDPQGQDVWMSHNGSKKGYSAYKVADGVRRHYAVGLGIYDVLINTNGKSVFLDDAVEVPDAPGVAIENACIVELSNGKGPIVGFNHIVNGQGSGIRTGKDSGGGYAVQRVFRYSDSKADVADDYYKVHPAKR